MTRRTLELAAFRAVVEAHGFSRAKKVGAKRPSVALTHPQHAADFHWKAIAPIAGVA